MQRQIMDSLTVSRRAVGQLKGDISSGPLQHPAAAGAAPGAHRPEPAAAERAPHPARGARRRRSRPPRRRAARPPRATPPSRPAAAVSASADQMYEASLAQLRRGSTGTARLGLREMLRTYPTSPRAPDALYFIGQSFAAENPDSAAAYYTQVVDRYRHVRPGPVGAVQPGPARRAPEGQRQGQGCLPARGAEVPPVGRGRAGPRSPEGARALSPGAAAA